MSLPYQDIYQTALFVAVLSNKTEIVKLLLKNDKIDVNVINILIIYFLVKFYFLYFNNVQKQNINFNEIRNKIFEKNYITYKLMIFKNIF